MTLGPSGSESGEGDLSTSIRGVINMGIVLNKVMTGNAFGLDPYLLKDIEASRPKHTPDWPLLQMYEHHTVFLWGDTMSGHRAHTMVDGLNSHNALTKQDFVMLKRNLGKATFPVVLDVPERAVYGDVLGRANPAKVYGEVFTLRPHLVIELDNYMANTIEYHRRRVDIIIPFHEVYKKCCFGQGHKPFIETWKSERLYFRKRAWMYVADFSFYMDQNNYDDRFTHEGLLKTRPYNEHYVPRYHFTRDDF